MEFLSTISLRNSAVNYVVPSYEIVKRIQLHNYRGRGVLIWEPSVATGLDGLTVVFNAVFLGLLTGHVCLLTCGEKGITVVLFSFLFVIYIYLSPLTKWDFFLKVYSRTIQMCKFQKVDENISLSLWLALFTLTVCILTIMVLCTRIHMGKF